MKTDITIGEYLISRLRENHVDHMFGIPGDYVLGFYDLVDKSPEIKMINTCDEQGAGFAADAYARVRGLGVVCITYGVGGLKVANTTAQAYAEKSPVIVISGGPGLKERETEGLLHHQITDFDAQKRVFEELTIAETIIDSPETARHEIDRIIGSVLKYKRPGYIELPRDLVFVPCEPGPQWKDKRATSNKDALKEAVAETTRLINNAERPVILAGVELHRFGLEKVIGDFAKKHGIPVAATILAKSVVADIEEFYLGVFEGGTEQVTKYVESSDCLLLLGTFLSDLNLGMFTSGIEPTNSIYAASDRISIKHHSYDSILFEDFIRELATAPVEKREFKPFPRPQVATSFPEELPGDSEVTVAGLFQYLNNFIKSDTVIVADVGDALFGANDLFVYKAAGFFSPAYYASLGFAVPGALGIQLAKPEGRPLVLVGDGAFQMTGTELSSIARYGLNPIVIVLNNDGYGTERPMLDGSYNDVHPWNFSKIPEVLGCGTGFKVQTYEQLQHALAEADLNSNSFTIIDVVLDRHDRSPAMVRLTSKLAERVKRSAQSS